MGLEPAIFKLPAQIIDLWLVHLSTLWIRTDRTSTIHNRR